MSVIKCHTLAPQLRLKIPRSLRLYGFNSRPNTKKSTEFLLSDVI